MTYEYLREFSIKFETVIMGYSGAGGVSPAYGYIGSALVKCSNNEGGLGPRYNREEDPGSSIFSMLMV